MQDDKRLNWRVYQQNCELQQSDRRGDPACRHDKEEFREAWIWDIVTQEEIEGY